MLRREEQRRRAVGPCKKEERLYIDHQKLNNLLAAICARAMNALSDVAVASGAILTVVDPGIELRLTSTLFAPLRRTAATAFILPDSTENESKSNQK